MSWDNPLALLTGLAIPAILVLWMLKPRRPRMRVPSVMLWPASPAERQSARPWQRLRNHPLLWLQILIASLLAVSAAQPFLPAEAAGRHLIVLLDASGSMRARDGAPDRFAAAKAAVVDLARAMGPDQRLTVVRLDQQPRVLIASASAAQVEAALSAEEPSYGPPDLAAGVALASGLTQGPAEWVLASDGGLTLPEGARRPAGTGFRQLPVGGQAANVAVTGVALREGEGDVTLQAGIKNLGAEAVSGRLQLLAEGEIVGSREWRLEGGAEGYVTWTHLPVGPKWYEARLSGVPAGANVLEADDRGWAVAAGSSEAGALLITPGNSFLERILSVQGGVRAFKAAPADWDGLISSGGAAYPLVVLDRLWPETMPVGSALVVGPPSGAEFQPKEMWPKVGHPLLRHVEWSEVHVAKARRLQLGPGWETVIDSDGGPLLAVRTEGGRRQAVLAFELGQSDLPLRPAFPVLMVNLMEWLNPRSEEAPRTVVTGAPVPVDAVPLAKAVWMEGPNGTRAELAPPWPPLPFRAPSPGLYRIVQETDAGPQAAFLIAGGYDPSESDLTPRAFEVPAVGDATVLSARGSFAFWPWLAGALLLVSLVEWWVDARGR